jgi:hypothetical protein
MDLIQQLGLMVGEEMVGMMAPGTGTGAAVVGAEGVTAVVPMALERLLQLTRLTFVTKIMICVTGDAESRERSPVVLYTIRGGTTASNIVTKRSSILWLTCPKTRSTGQRDRGRVLSLIQEISEMTQFGILANDQCDRNAKEHIA